MPQQLTAWFFLLLHFDLKVRLWILIVKFKSLVRREQTWNFRKPGGPASSIQNVFSQKYNDKMQKLLPSFEGLINQLKLFSRLFLVWFWIIRANLCCSPCEGFWSAASVVAVVRLDEWRCFRYDRKCLFLCIYNPQIKVLPTSSFSVSFNGNRIKNQPLSPFFIGRMFLHEPSWKYSAKLVGS